MGERIANGTRVTWTSQSGGYEKTKTGTVLAFIAPEQSPYRIHPELDQVPQSRIKFDRWSTNPRYLVLVPRGGKSAISDYYAPLAKWLEK